MAEELAKKMNGKYKLERSENFDKYLQGRGMPFMARKMAGTMSPYLEITISGDTVALKMYVAVRTIQDINCKLGEEADAGTRPDGAKLKAKYWLEDGKLMCTQTADKGGSETITREMLDDNSLLMTMKGGEDVCKRWFKRCQ